MASKIMLFSSIETVIPMDKLRDKRIAQLYDASVPDWPGEIDFYLGLAEPLKASRGSLLEVACGTGRVALHLAQAGLRVVGIDRSLEMLQIARRKSNGMANVHWILADMRAIGLSMQFELVVIPGHSFQFMLTPADQLACLEGLKRLLKPDGTLVIHLDHQDFSWLGALQTGKGGEFEPAGEVTDPHTGNQVRISRAWWFQPATQIASALTAWEELNPHGQVLDRWERGPLHLHCAFRHEMEHLLARAGFQVEAVYGDFSGNELNDESSEMIWLAKKNRA
ncbi:MAG TPA: class I SAM-dependent methyltransferase [Anaerolineales bacterium]|nr:class I SAM-dependent methyltransferase [Anaerolineales bacterium]